MLEREYKLVFLPIAEDDLTEIVSYISHQLQNPTSAMNVMNRISDAIYERSNAPESFQRFESAKNRSDINLLNNAINYTGEDKKVIVRQLIRNHVVRFEAQDSGEGIPAEQIPFIWDRYYKGNKTHRRPIVGTGLGLSIVKSILEQHQAAYGVCNLPDGGCVFWFELPAAPA